jgi:hypothetical protein
MLAHPAQLCGDVLVIRVWRAACLQLPQQHTHLCLEHLERGSACTATDNSSSMVRPASCWDAHQKLACSNGGMWHAKCRLAMRALVHNACNRRHCPPLQCSAHAAAGRQHCQRPLTLGSIAVLAREHAPQRVGDAQHDLREAARQHSDEVVACRHVLRHAVVVVAKAGLSRTERRKATAADVNQHSCEGVAESQSETTCNSKHNMRCAVQLDGCCPCLRRSCSCGCSRWNMHK